MVIRFEGFLEHFQTFRSMSDETIAAYRSDLKRFGEFCQREGVVRVSKINHDLITRYINFMKESAVGRGGGVGLSDATIARRLVAVSTYLNYLAATSRVKIENPIADFTRRWKRNNRPKPVDADTIARLLASVKSKRDGLLFQMYLSTGLRLEEMEQLDVSSIKIKKISGKRPGESFVIGEGEVVGKGSKQRTFYVDARTLKVWAEFVRGRSPEEPLFLSSRNRRMAARTMQERLAHWCRKADISHLNIHRFRHTCATNLANANMDVLELKQLMGHESLQTTLQYTKIHEKNVARGYHAAMEFVSL